MPPPSIFLCACRTVRPESRAGAAGPGGEQGGGAQCAAREERVREDGTRPGGTG